jgi:uncharacterized protein
MAKGQFKVLDSDMHVIEPADLFQRYGDPEMRDRMPYGTGKLNLSYDGKPWGRHATFDEVRQAGTAPIVQADRESRWAPFEAKGWTGQAQLEGMDIEGIDAAVLYPSRGLFALTVTDLDPKLAAAMAGAYNNWMYEFIQADPSRLFGAAMIPPFDVDDAIAETRRAVKELGFKAVFLRPNPVRNRNWHDPYYDPLWAEIADLGVPLGFHEGSSTGLPEAGQRFADNMMLLHAVSHPFEQMMAADSLCGGGVLERHPNLRVAFLEGNCSWLTFFLWRLDEHYELFGQTCAPELTMKPSEYFRRQCFASVEADEEPAKYVIQDGLADRLVFSTDFPHTDSKYPHAVDRFLELPISDEDKRKILWDNCAAYYGLAG